MVIKWLEELLELEVSGTKSIVLASSPNVAKQIEQHRDTKRVKAATQANMLGAGTRAAAGRSTAVLKTHLKHAKARLQRVRALMNAE